MTRAFCSIVTRSHLRLAFALSRSLRSAHNEEPHHVLVTDARDRDELPAPPPGLHYRLLTEFDDELPPRLRHYFDAFELCNALKPFLVRRLLQEDHAKVVFLDADLFVAGAFTPVWRALDDHAVLLTPHLLSPPALHSPAVNEIEIVDQGVYNGGFTAWAHSAATRNILTWMCERFVLYGFNDRPHGMFVDQKLLPLLREYFPDQVHIWRHPGANIAFWNVHERPVEAGDAGYTVQGEPVLFFHMSGFRESLPDSPCSYLPAAANHHILEQGPWFHAVMRDYLALLRSVPPPPPAPPYPYTTYDGFVLFPALRRILFRTGKLSWRDPAVRRAVAVEKLKRVKRWMLARLGALR